MNFLNSRLYHVLEVFSNFLILNIIWIVMCIPIVTIFPATAAMFGVVRKWAMKRDPAMLRTYFSLFKENFKQSFIIGIIWILLGIILAIDFMLINQMEGTFRFILLLLIMFVGILYALCSVFLFPVMVHFQTNWIGVLKNSLFISISQLLTSIGCFLIIATMMLIFIYFPMITFVIGSVTSFFVYKLCNRSFQKIEAMRSEKEPA